MASPRLTFRDLTPRKSKASRHEGQGTPSKRARFRDLFKEECSTKVKDVDKLKECLAAVKDSVLTCDLSAVSDISTLIPSLVTVYGFETVQTFLGALNTVPYIFMERVKYICNIVNCGQKKIPESIIHVLIPRLDTYARAVKIVLNSDYLWKCSLTYGEGYFNFCVPPCETCLNCGGTLYVQKKSQITVYSMDGPIPGMKCTTRCKKGCGALFNLDRYHVPGDGINFYGTGCELVSASNCSYMTKDVHELMCESGNHAFVSHHAFSEIYNSVFLTSMHTTNFKTWLMTNSPSVLPDNDPDEETAICDKEDETDPEPEPKRLRYRLTRKKAMSCYLNGELMNEMTEENEKYKISPGGTRESLMKEVDRKRRQKLYQHKSCSETCKRQGCETLRVIDSCWKVCMPHCMFAVETHVAGLPLINLPNVCCKEPMANSVFCKKHHMLLENNNIPTKKGDFLKYIGCNGNPSSKEDMNLVDKKTLELSRQLSKMGMKNDQESTAPKYQGTEDLVAKINPETWDRQLICNKDTGEKARLRQRSRGHFISVTGGGHIQYFEPIFKSESPSQIFLIVLRVMMLEISKVPEEKMNEAIERYVLSYDNMCHLDSLRASKEPLPFPAPYDTMWQKITKIIDRLHLQNHKNVSCKEKYDPGSIPQEHNTMIAEQTFSWFSRFKKVVNSMTQTHHLFYIHRNIKRRNTYTERCREYGQCPLLPGVNVKMKKW